MSFYRKRIGSSVIVSKPGFLDLHEANLYLYSFTPSKPNLDRPITPPELTSSTSAAISGETLTTPPPVIRLGAELAAIRKTATSAAVTSELSFLIGSIT